MSLPDVGWDILPRTPCLCRTSDGTSSLEHHVCLFPSAEHYLLPLLSREPLPRTPYVCLHVGRLSVYRVKTLEQLGSTLVSSFHFTDKLCCWQ